MALLPGLRGNPQDNPDARRSAGEMRTQVQDPARIPALQPSAAPVETYFRPAMPDQDNELTRIAAALQAFNPVLTRFAETQQALDRQNAPDKVARALTGLNAQQRAEVLNNDPSLRDAASQRLGGAMLGSQTAEERITQMRKDFAEGKFDKDTGNFDEWVNGYLRRDIEANKNPQFASQYNERITAGVASLREEHAKYLAGRTLENQDQMIFNHFKSQVGLALDKNVDPAQAFDALRQSMGTIKLIGNKPMPEQEKLLVTLIGRGIADLDNKSDPDYEKKYKLFMGLLNAPRTDPVTGQQLGSLRDSTTLGGQVAQIITKAEASYNARTRTDNLDRLQELNNLAHGGDPNFKTKLEAYRKEFPEALSDENVLSLQNQHRNRVEHMQKEAEKAHLKQQVEGQKNSHIGAVGLPALTTGSLFAIQDTTIINEKGETETWSAEDIRKATVEQAMRNIEQKYAGRDDEASQNEKLAAQVHVYQQSLMKNEEWSKLLKNSVAAAGTVTAAGGDPPPVLTKAYDLYKRLNGKSPQLLAQHVDEKSQAFFELARVGQEYMGLDEKAALAAATRATFDKNFTRSDTDMRESDITQKVRSAIGGWRMPFTTNLTNAYNSDQAVAEVRQSAMLIHRAFGLPMEEAIKAAGERVKNNYTVVNGNAVRIADKQVPPNFGELANRYVDEWYDANKAKLDEMGYKKTDILVFGMPNASAWSLVVKGQAGPIPLAGANFTTANLPKYVEQLLTEKKVREAQELERRDEPVIQLGNPDNKFSLSIGGPAFLDKRNGTPEEQRRYDQERERIMQGRRQKYNRQNQPSDKPADPQPVPDPLGNFSGYTSN